MANSNQLGPEAIKSYIDTRETNYYKTTPTAKAVIKGLRLGEKSGAGGHVESGFRPPKGSGRRSD
jgi:hypothetical protein